MDPLEIVAQPRRREILRLVWDRELSSGQIAAQFAVSFGAVSQHLGVLRDAGYVRVRVAGNQRFYQVDQGRLGPLAQVLEAMWAASLDRLADAVESGAGRDATRGETDP